MNLFSVIRKTCFLSLCFSFFVCNSVYCTETDPLVKYIENKNQWPASIHFSARIGTARMLVGPGRFYYQFIDAEKMQKMHEGSHNSVDADPSADEMIKGQTISVYFLGANQTASPLKIGKSSEYYNYFLGNDSKHWASGAHAYEGIVYPSFYDGVDLKVYSAGNNPKYDLMVAPYGDPSQIRIEYDGADEFFLDNGNLYLKTSLGEVVEKRPFAYQFIDGKRKEVLCAYKLLDNVLSFEFPDNYDSCYPLVIDPLLIFSTYSGSAADNWGSTATPGEDGHLYSAGVTAFDQGRPYPVTPGVFQSTNGGFYDIGILKYDSAGKKLLYSTMLGGSGGESAHSLVMNADQELVILGTTSSFNFPTSTTAYDRQFSGGTFVNHVFTYNNGSDIFVAKIARDGKQLLASTFLGGTENDGLNPTDNFPLTKNYGDQLRGDIITDGDGNIYLSSVTLSSNFPIVNGMDPSFGGGVTDAVVVKFNSDLSAILWSSFVGGDGADASHTIKLDRQHNIFVAGGTTSADFPVTAGSYQASFSGTVDGWIAKIASDGSSILNCTYTGTPGFDQIYFLDLNEDEEPYVYGQTNDTRFPISSTSLYSVKNSGQFIQKFNNELSQLIFSTVFGTGRGQPDISPTAFLVNDCNNIYVSGWAGGLLNTRVPGAWNTSSFGLRVSNDAIQKTTSGHDFYFMVLTDDATEFLYGTFFGGGQSYTHVDGGTCRFDKNGIVYHAVCSGCGFPDGLPKSDFPTTPGAWSRINGSLNCNNAAFKFDLSSLKARFQTNSLTLDQPGMQVVCRPDPFVFQNLSTGGEIFEWYFGDGQMEIKQDTASFPHYYENPGQYLVKLKAIDRGTCKVVDSTSLTITVFQAESEVQDDDALCYGDPYVLKSSGGTFYEWSSNGEIFSNSPNPTVSPSDTTEYFVTIIEANGCLQKDTVQLNVIPSIAPEFTYFREPDCSGRPKVHITNLTDSLRAGDVMVLNWGDGSQTDLPEDIHNYEQDGVYNIKLVVSREFCVFEQSINYPVFQYTVPNIITPGVADGDNDQFTIQFGSTPGITPAHYGFKVSLTVYNRWGTVLLKEDDYQYDWSGEGLAAGIYYYDVEIEEHGSCKSWLQIMK